MKTLKYIVIALFLTTLSCSKKDSSPTKIGDIDLDSAIENAEKRRAADPNSSGGNTCLLGHQKSYDKLLTEAEVLELTGFTKDVMEVNFRNQENRLAYNELAFRFKNQRLAIVPYVKQKVAVSDVVILRGIKPMSQNEFQRNYRAITEEEMQLAKDAMKDISEGNTNDPEAEKLINQAKKANVQSEDIKKVGDGLLDTFSEVTKAYVPIENIADAAVWNSITNELMVLDNGVKFEIYVDISEDMEANKELAIQVAQLVLKKCK